MRSMGFMFTRRMVESIKHRMSLLVETVLGVVQEKVCGRVGSMEVKVKVKVRAATIER